MQAYLTLVRRELSGFFASVIGYVVIASVLLLLGFSFLDLLEKLATTPSHAPLTEIFYSTYYFWYILLLTAPVITMRSFAFEKLSGTYETLMTAPVSDLQVVLAKFTGALLFYALTWLPLTGCILIVRHYTHEPTMFDWRGLTSAYAGLLLIGALYMAMGCFASALTRSQILAAMNGFVLGLALFLVSLPSLVPAPSADWAAQARDYVCLSEHLEDFVLGVLDTRHLVFYVTLTGFFLFLTLKAVESRRWR